MAVVWLEGWTGEAEEFVPAGNYFFWLGELCFNQPASLSGPHAQAGNFALIWQMASTWTVARARGQTSGACPWAQVTDNTGSTGTSRYWQGRKEKTGCQSSACNPAPTLSGTVASWPSRFLRVGRRGRATTAHAWTLEPLCTPLRPLNTDPPRLRGRLGECRDSGAGASRIPFSRTSKMLAIVVDFCVDQQRIVRLDMFGSKNGLEFSQF